MKTIIFLIASALLATAYGKTGYGTAYSGPYDVSTDIRHVIYFLFIVPIVRYQIV